MLREDMRRPNQSTEPCLQLCVTRTGGASDHPLRPLRTMVDEIPAEMSPVFDTMYKKMGRPSIPTEKLLRAQLLQMLYSIRSERLLMEEIDYSILFRWFVGLSLDEQV